MPRKKILDVSYLEMSPEQKRSYQKEKRLKRLQSQNTDKKEATMKEILKKINIDLQLIKNALNINS